MIQVGELTGTQGKQPYLSVVVPVYNEAGNIAGLDGEIKAALEGIPGEHEIIYINDGSTDGSMDQLLTLKGVKVIDMNRNYGQATALDAGFKAAQGEVVASLDGDGQNDPADIPRLLAKLQVEELDVVAGWRKERKDKGGIKVLTRLGRFARSLLISDTVHDTGCTLRVYRSEAVKGLDIGGEMHRYILALLRWKGFRIGEMVVRDRARVHGVSKYGYSKMFRGFIDLMYVSFIHKYSQRPLHLFGYMSLTSFAAGTLSGIWTLWGKLFLGLSLNRNGWSLITFFFLISGIVLFSVGIIVDLLIRTQLTLSPYEQRYHVRKVIVS